MRKPAALRAHPALVPLCAGALAVVCFGQALWIHAKAEVAQVLIASAWERTLARTHTQQLAPQKPWQWADTWPVARLQWKENGKEEDLYVLAGGNGPALAFGPGHLDDSAPPGRGATVVAGHRDTHFAFLRELQPGSELRLQNAHGEELVYRVAELQVKDSLTEPLLIDPARDTLTLVTCYPFDAPLPGGPLRYVVTATRYEF